MRALVLFLALLAPALSSSESMRATIQSAHRNALESGKTATDALRDLRAVAGLDKFRGFGTWSGMDRRDVEVDEKRLLPVFSIRLDHLRDFDKSSEADPRQLLIGTPRVLYPVIADGEVVTGVELVDTPEGWEPSRLGLTTLTENALGTIETLDVNPRKTILVEIPAMRLWFIAFERNGALYLASIADSDVHDLRQGIAIDAASLLRRLSDRAKEIDPELPV